MMSIVLRKYRIQQSAAMARNYRMLLSRPIMAPLSLPRMTVAGLHQSVPRRTGISMEDARKDLDSHRAEAYSKAEQFASKTRALREGVKQKISMVSPANKGVVDTLIDNYSRSLLELQERVQQHARHVDEEITMLNAQLSDDIVQEADDIRLADRRLDEMLARANRIVDDDTRRLQHRLQSMTTGSGLLVDDVELGSHNWHLHNLEASGADNSVPANKSSQAKSAADSSDNTKLPVQEIMEKVSGKLGRDLPDNVSHPTRQYARGMYDDVADAVENIDHKAKRATFAMGSAAETMGEKAANMGSNVKEAIKETAQQAKEGAQGQMKKAADTLETPVSNLGEKARNVGSSLKEATKSATQQVEDKMSELGGSIQNKVNEAGEKIREMGSDMRGRAQQAGEKAKEMGSDMRNKAQEKAEEMGNDMQGRAQQAGKKAKEMSSDMRSKVQERAEEMDSDMKNKTQQAGERAKEVGSDMRSKAQQAGEQVKEMGSGVMGTFRQMKNEIQGEAGRTIDAVMGARPGMSKRSAEESLQDTTTNIRQEAGRTVDAVMGARPGMSKESVDEKLQSTATNIRQELDRTIDAVVGGGSSVGGKSTKESLQDTATNVKQKAKSGYDTLAANMSQDPKHIFEEKMGNAYDMLKDGMDMTGLAEAAKSKVEPIVDNAKQTMASVKDQAVKAGERVSSGASAAAATAAAATGMNTGKTVPLNELRGVAAYDLIERMEEVQDHPAELNSLRSAEINMYGNDRKLREAVFTWSEDALLENSDEAAPPKHDIRTAVGSIITAAPGSSSSSSPTAGASTDKNEFDDEALNALLDEAEDFGATIHENPSDMLRRKPRHVR